MPKKYKADQIEYFELKRRRLRCRFTPIKTKGFNALASIKKCKFKRAIKKGNSVRIKLYPDAEEVVVTNKLEESFDASKQRKVYDLMFLPTRGQIVYEPGAMTTNEVAEYSSTALAVKTVEDSTFLLNRIYYALEDNMTVGVDWNYLVGRDLEATDILLNTTATSEASGLVEPNFFGIYRFSKKEGKRDWIVDGLAELTLSPFTTETPGVTNSGNGWLGRQILKLGARAGQKVKRYTWNAKAMMNYNTSQTRENPDNNSEAERGSYFDLLLSGNGQIKFEDNDWFANGTFGIGLHSDWEDTAGGTTSTIERGMSLFYGGEIGYAFNDRVHLAGGYDYVSHDYDVSTPEAEVIPGDFSYSLLKLSLRWIFK